MDRASRSPPAFRVLHLIKALGRGGAEVLLAEGLRHADRARFDLVYGHLLTDPNTVAADLEAEGVHVECFGLDGNLKMLLGASRVARFVRGHRVDLIHAHLPMAGVVARIAGRMAGVPVAYTEHAIGTRYRAPVRLLAAATWRWQDHVIAISDDVEADLRRRFTTTVPITRIWNGVDVDRFSPEAVGATEVRAALGAPRGGQIIGTVAVLREAPGKRLDLWLEAARRILARKADAHFLIVGEGPMKARLEAMAEELGVASRVRFAGFQSDVRPYLAAMDVFLMSSEHEGFGLAPAEALAMGVPVVATDVSGVRNVVRDGVTGWLAPFDDQVTQGLADRVVALLDDPETRSRFARAGRDDVVARFGVDRMQRELEAVYDQVLAKRGAHVPRMGVA